MKLPFLLALAGLTSLAAPVFGANIISYTATADPNLGPDSVDNFGNPVDVWGFGHSGDGTAPANYGSFLGNSANNGGGNSGAGAGTSAWAIYANRINLTSPSNNEATIGHTFDGGILTNTQSVSINFDGGYVDQGQSYGIRLFGPSNFVFALTFGGGDAGFRYYDASASSGSLANTNSYFGYNPNGFNFRYTQNTATTYSVLVTDTTGTLASFSGTVSGSPDFIQIYNNAAGNDGNYDVFANNLAIVPEPGSYALLAGGVGMGLALAARRRSAVA